MFVAGEVVEASVELVAEFAIQCGCKENRSVTTHALFLKAASTMGSSICNQSTCT